MTVGSIPGAPSEWVDPADGIGNAPARINPAIVQLVMLIAIPFCLSSEDGVRLLIALVTAGSLIGLMNFVPVTGILATFAYIVIMSGLRRWLFPIFGATGTDPFLMVGPVVVCLNFSNLLIGRSIPRNTPISRYILAILCIMALEIFNPLQGGLVVGIAGAVFYIIPIFWFYVGRLYATEAAYQKIVGFAIGVTILTALYGQYQTFFGFLPSEVAYTNNGGFSELITASVARVYSTLTSPAEYATLLVIAGVFCCAYALRRNKVYFFLLVGFAIAEFLTAVRGEIVLLFFACCCLWALQGKTPRIWLPRLLLAVVLAIAGSLWSLHGAQGQIGNNKSGPTSALVGHQVEGLLNPTESTASGHFTSQIQGVVTGISHPLGFGLGATTLASAKYSQSSFASFEGDAGNMFASLGIAGGILYLLMAYHCLRAAVLNWHRSRSIAALCALGVVVVTVNGWLAGGNYSIMVLIWFSIGYIDRKALEYQTADRKIAEEKKALKKQNARDGIIPGRRLPLRPVAASER